MFGLQGDELLLDQLNIPTGCRAACDDGFLCNTMNKIHAESKILFTECPRFAVSFSLSIPLDTLLENLRTTNILAKETQ